MITRTINTNKLTVLTFNYETSSLESVKLDITGDIDEKNITRTIETSGKRKFLKVEEIETTSIKFGMDENDFQRLSVKIDEKEKGKRYISRTIDSTVGKLLYINSDTLTFHNSYISFKGDRTVEEINEIMYLSKNTTKDRYVKCEETKHIQDTFYVLENDFRIYGKVLED